MSRRSIEPIRKKWQSIIRLYGGRDGFEVQVERARQMLDDPLSVLSQNAGADDAESE